MYEHIFDQSCRLHDYFFVWAADVHLYYEQTSKYNCLSNEVEMA